MIFGLTLPTLGMRRVRTPFSNEASALSASSPLGRTTEREKAPNRHSRPSLQATTMLTGGTVGTAGGHAHYLHRLAVTRQTPMFAAPDPIC